MVFRKETRALKVRVALRQLLAFFFFFLFCVLFIFVFEAVSCSVVQAGFELLG